MKNIFQVVKNFKSRRLLSVLLISYAMVLCAGSAYADDKAGFFSLGAADVYMWNGKNDIWIGGGGYAGSGVDTYHFGIIEKLYLNQWWTKVWKKTGEGDVCNVYFYYKLTGGDSFTRAIGDHFNNQDVVSGSSTNQTWGKGTTMSVNIINDFCKNVPGNYTFEFYFEAITNQNGTSNCADKRFYSNNGQNYKADFTYPGIILSTNSVKIKQKDGTKPVSFTEVGFDNTDYTATVGAGEPFEVVAGSKKTDGLTVKYTGNSLVVENGTLTITPPSGMGKAVTVALEGSNGDRPVVMIGDSAEILGKDVNLFAYLKYTGCDLGGISNYGFAYVEGDTDPKEAASPINVAGVGESPLQRGSTYTGSIKGLTLNSTYTYRPYVYSSDNVKYWSENKGSFKIVRECPYPMGDTIYIDIDQTVEEKACSLKYTSIKNAIAAIKSISDYYDDETDALLKHIVLNVKSSKSLYTGSSAVGYVEDSKGNKTAKTGGSAYSDKVNMIEDINNCENPTKWLIIRAENPASQPRIEHIVLRNSKKVQLKDLRIEGADTKFPDVNGAGAYYENAIDIDNGNPYWLEQPVGDVANAEIKITNCYIKSNGFCCVHVSAYDGITMENNDIEADLLGETGDNSIAWGSSVKFMHCKNIRFVRNSLRGSHTTTLWIQGSQNVLAMNNVCWNDNEYTSNVAFVRLVSQIPSQGCSNCVDDVLSNIGIYYNTLYLAEGTKGSDVKVDFYRLGSTYTNTALLSGVLDGNYDKYDPATIAFKYNNCYSYDTSHVTGRNNDASVFLGNDHAADWNNAIWRNNFWSKADNRSGESSAFALGSEAKFLNVSNAVCHTAGEDPNTLVIKTAALNVGDPVTTDVSKMGANDLFNDRLHAENGVRPQNDGTWTLGAYQNTSPGAPIEVIVWKGGAAGESSVWDNRNNWYKLNGDKVEQLTCIDVLSENVKVIIPAKNSTVYPVPDGGITVYPTLPSYDDDKTAETSRNKYKTEYQEFVEAGAGSNSLPGLYANNIEIEEGGAFLGAEHLKDATKRRYNSATNSITIERDKWVLVGTMIKPFEGSTPRYIQSGDYYLNTEPQIYMRKAELNEQTAKWQRTFSSMVESVEPESMFALRIPDEYGPRHMMASRYYRTKDPSKVGDGTVSKTFPFTGVIYNEESLNSYNDLTAATPVMLSNTYPANIKVSELLSKGTVHIYNTTSLGFDEADKDDVIYPQQGFIFTPVGTSLAMTSEMYDASGNTKPEYAKSVTATSPYIKISAGNVANSAKSKIKVKLDELKSDSYSILDDGLKIFNDMETSLPELYILWYDKQLSSVTLPSMDEAIPLGLKLKAKATVRFAMMEQYSFAKAELVDTEVGETYDLLSEEPCEILLGSGTYEGRFYLNLSPKSDDDIPTGVNDLDSQIKSISIWGDGDMITICSSPDVILTSAVITDVTGAVTTYSLKDEHYNKLKINGNKGVYIIKAVGDILSKTEKIIIK